MADERELIAEREKSVAELRKRGVNPYANGFVPTHTTAELRAKFAGATLPEVEAPPVKGAPPTLLSPEKFTVAGRVAQIRDFGKATFVKLMDRAGELQVWMRKDLVGDAACEIWKFVERGDFIGAVGGATITKTGELTIVADSFQLLTKATRPLPEKFHGLSDQEIRYRQRYVDLVVNPEVRDVFRKRQRHRARHPPLPRRARLPGGRDADDALDRRRRGGEALQDPPQRARPRPQHAHRARAAPEAARRGRHRARLRDRPQLPQRGAVAPAQPRVHDARVLSGVRDVRGSHGAHRGALPRARARGRGRRDDHVPGPVGRPRRRRGRASP